jgi:adenosine deaminase
MAYTSLHDHLDGGLRANTIIEIANNKKIPLPSENEEVLKKWFFENISTEKNQVFKKFELTISVMQDEDSIERITYEAVQDLREDNVEYAELRYAPLQHIYQNLMPQQVVDAVNRGLINAEIDFGGEFYSILCAMRQNNDSDQVAELAINNINTKVIGFDLAGPEFMNPPSKHLKATNLIYNSGIGLTIHAGEAADLSYIEDAIFNCKAQRIGHGWQIIEGCQEIDNIYYPKSKIAEYIIANQIPLEICISSNAKSGASSVTFESHPAVKLLRSGFNVTLNSDNRLMAKTKLSNEFKIAKDKGLTDEEEIQLIKNSVNARFTNLN